VFLVEIETRHCTFECLKNSYIKKVCLLSLKIEVEEQRGEEGHGKEKRKTFQVIRRRWVKKAEIISLFLRINNTSQRRERPCTNPLLIFVLQQAESAIPRTCLVSRGSIIPSSITWVE